MTTKTRTQPLGKKLMKMRRERAMTVQHLANETGLGVTYIGQVEKGEVIPPVAVILQLSRALQIDSSLLLKEERQMAGRSTLNFDSTLG